MSRLIDADLIQYEPMLSAKGNGMYEDVMVAYKSQIDDLPIVEPEKNRLQHAIDGKTEEETYDFLKWLMLEYAKQYTDSRSAVIKWLGEGGADMRGEADG